MAVHLAAPDGGIIAYLTPASFLGGQYFKALRRLLAEEAPPVRIDIVDGRDAFEGVLQEVALSVFRRGSPPKMAPCSVVHVGLDGLRIRAAGCFALPLDPADCWILPRDANDAAVVECMMSMPARLVDWGYSVSTGPLVWNRHKPALHNEPRNGSVPIVWAESVTGSGIFHLKNEQRNHAAFYQSSGPLDPKPCHGTLRSGPADHLQGEIEAPRNRHATIFDHTDAWGGRDRKSPQYARRHDAGALRFR